mmetsp:Transcript_1708/g.4336  ORF Transcript_1708/g.4336 Transcript_1708/m.4336 type:complete len:230 (-) Transcript_1708:1985-2674(-)
MVVTGRVGHVDGAPVAHPPLTDALPISLDAGRVVEAHRGEGGRGDLVGHAHPGELVERGGVPIVLLVAVRPRIRPLMREGVGQVHALAAAKGRVGGGVWPHALVLAPRRLHARVLAAVVLELFKRLDKGGFARVRPPATVIVATPPGPRGGVAVWTDAALGGVAAVVSGQARSESQLGVPVGPILPVSAHLAATVRVGKPPILEPVALHAVHAVAAGVERVPHVPLAVA